MNDYQLIAGLIIFTVNSLYFTWIAFQWGKHE